MLEPGVSQEELSVISGQGIEEAKFRVGFRGVRV